MTALPWLHIHPYTVYTKKQTGKEKANMKKNIWTRQCVLGHTEMVTTLPILQRCVRQHVTMERYIICLLWYIGWTILRMRFRFGKHVKHGKLINKGFELYETINIHSVYIQNNAVHYDQWGQCRTIIYTIFG